MNDDRVVAEAEGRLFTGAFVALTVSDLAYFVASGVLIGVTPFLVTGPLGSDTLGLGLALGAFSVTSLVLRPLVGRIADQLGRRPLLVAGAGLFSVLIAAHLLVQSLWLLIVLRVLLGAAESLYFVAGFAALADLAPPGRAGEALSWNSIALYTGIALGPPVGQLLMQRGGYSAAWLGGALCAAVATVLALRVPETRERAPGTAAPAQLIHRQVIRPGLALFVGVAAGAGFLALAGLRAAELGFQAWSVVPLAYGLVVVSCRVIFPHVADRVPPLLVAAGSLGTSTAGLVVLSVTDTVPGILSGAAVLGVGAAFLTPAVFAAIFNLVPAYERGAAAGTATVFIDLGLGGGPLLLGFLAARSSIPVAFAIAGLLTAIGIPVLLRGPRQPVVDRG